MQTYQVSLKVLWSSISPSLVREREEGDEETEARGGRGGEEEDELKKTVDLSPCEYLRVGSALIDTLLIQEVSVALIMFNYPVGSWSFVVSQGALAIVSGLR